MPPGSDHDPRHAQDDAADARAREIRGSRRRWRQPSFGLDDGILIKDNHVRLAGGVVPRSRACGEVRICRSRSRRRASIRSTEALQAGADIILLDNLSTPDIIEAVRRCRGRAKTEISGGVTLRGCRSWPRPAPTMSRSARSRIRPLQPTSASRSMGSGSFLLSAANDPDAR